MSAIKWYKRDPTAALNGMMRLTLEQRGAYNTILDLIYSHANNLVDDDRFLAGWMMCDLRVWRRIKSALIEAGKIEIIDGRIMNHKATEVIDDALHRVAVVKELNQIKGRKSGVVRSKNKEIDEPKHEPKSNTTTTTVKKEEANASSKEKRATPIPENFTPDERGVALALDLGIVGQWFADTLVEHVDYWRGTGKAMKDWQAVFRNRLRAVARLKKEKSHGKTTRADTFAILDAVTDEAIRREGRWSDSDETNIVELSGLRESAA